MTQYKSKLNFLIVFR